MQQERGQTPMPEKRTTTTMQLQQRTTTTTTMMMTTMMMMMMTTTSWMQAEVAQPLPRVWQRAQPGRSRRSRRARHPCRASSMAQRATRLKRRACCLSGSRPPPATVVARPRRP